MYKQECYKIFSRKSIYIVFFIVILTMIYANKLPSEMTMKEEIYEGLYDTWGGPVTEEKVISAREKMVQEDNGDSSITSFEDRAASYVHFLVAAAGMNAEYLNERIGSLQEQLRSLNSNSYDYREASKELKMLYQIGEPHGFYLIRAWRDMFDLIEPTAGVIFLSVLLLLGLTPVFADEYTKRTVGLILATKHGKRKIVSAKILASITYVSTVLLSLHLVNLVLQWNKYGGFQGWDIPIQGLSSSYESLSMRGFELSPYALEVWQLYFITIVLQLLACVAVGILILFVSVISRNSMMAFFISAAILGIPFMINQIGFDRGVLSYVAHFNYAELVKVAGLFEEFIAYNVFGFPILYPVLLFLIFGIITVILLFLTLNRFTNQHICG